MFLVPKPLRILSQIKRSYALLRRHLNYHKPTLERLTDIDMTETSPTSRKPSFRVPTMALSSP